MLLEFNDDRFLISRLNFFLQLGLQSVRVEARFPSSLTSRLLFCHSSRAAAYNAYPRGFCYSKLLLSRRSLGNFLLWHACSISAKIAAIRQILSSFGIGELNCWKEMRLLTSHTVTVSEAYLIDVEVKDVHEKMRLLCFEMAQHPSLFNCRTYSELLFQSYQSSEASF